MDVKMSTSLEVSDIIIKAQAKSSLDMRQQIYFLFLLILSLHQVSSATASEFERCTDVGKPKFEFVEQAKDNGLYEFTVYFKHLINGLDRSH